MTLTNIGKKKTIKVSKSIIKPLTEKLMKEKNGYDWSYTIKVLFNIYYNFDNSNIENNRRYYKDIANELGITTK